jgi:hypothetical protein
MDDDTEWSTRHTAGPTIVARSLQYAAGLIAVGLLVAACGSSPGGVGVAGAGSSGNTTTGQSPPSGPSKNAALAFSRCMRAHGVPDFPDPNGNGQIAISTNSPSSDLGPNSPQMKTAQEACKSLMPGPGTPAQQHQALAGALKFAQCMRAHGVAVPDPTPQSGPQTGSQSGGAGGGSRSTGPDPNSPQFQAAMKVCQHYAPGGVMSVQASAAGKGGS